MDEAEVVALLKLAWEELYELDFDAVFGAWRGVHLEEETETVHITWENMYAGPPLMISIHRVTRALRMDYPREEFIELEQAEIERLRSLPPGEEIRAAARGQRSRNNNRLSSNTTPFTIIMDSWWLMEDKGIAPLGPNATQPREH